MKAFFSLFCDSMSIKELYKIYLNSLSISTDSRDIGKGDIFFALKGPSFNGNLFAEASIEKGAAYAIIDETIDLKNLKNQDKLIKVDDVLGTLQKLAIHHREQIDIPVIGITGSNGKTTTKELLAKVLSRSYSIFYTKGNLNNHIGVPLSVLSIREENEIAIIEMGANHVGEIASLCKICQPSHGLITNIGKAHLEGFGSFEGVIKAKSELYKHLETINGVAFINSNEQELMNISKSFNFKEIFYGKYKNSIPSFDLKLESEAPLIALDWNVMNEKKFKIQTHLFGIHNYENLLTAMFIGYYFKVPEEEIAQAIEAFVPKNNRSQIIENGSNRILLDAYNANPSSMEKSIRAFHKINFAGEKLLILGDMFELGESSAEEHLQIVKLVEVLGYKNCLLVGRHFSAIEQSEFTTYPDVQALIIALQDLEPLQQTFTFIKGSRGIKLEKLLKENYFTESN